MTSAHANGQTGPGGAPLAAEAFVERWWTSSDGLRLAVRDYPGAAGAARLPVVCLHGLTRNARDFEEVAPRLARLGRRVLAPDVRGRGRSARDPDPTRYAPATYARDVAEMAAALGVGRAVFVGTSMGGLITFALAASAPALVAAAVINDVGPVLDPAGLARIAAYAGREIAPRTWAEAAHAARELNLAAFPHYGADDWMRFARRLFREEDGRPVLDYDPAIAQPIRAGQGRPAPDLWPLFDILAAGRRLLLVRGALSDLLSEATAQEMARRAPDLRRVDVGGVGHAPTLSEPPARAALERFLEDVA